MSDLTPITREEVFYQSILNGQIPNLTPVTRQEMYLAAIAARIAAGGGGTGSGGGVASVGGIYPDLSGNVALKKLTFTGAATGSYDGSEPLSVEIPPKTYIGENGNWWIGDTDTGVAAGGSGGSNDEILSIETIYDTGQITVASDVVQIETGISLADLSNWKELSFHANIVADPWTATDIGIKLVEPSGIYGALLTGSGKHLMNAYMITRLIKGEDWFSARTFGRGNGNLATYPPTLNNAYTTADKVNLGYAAALNTTGNPLSKDAEIVFYFNAPGTDMQMRFAIMGIVKYEEEA